MSRRSLKVRRTPVASAGKAPTLSLSLRPVAFDFAEAIALGRAREIACFGARGDGKTWAALIGMLMHAQCHADHGYPVPVPWIGVADTYQAHRLKTVRTLEDPTWQGIWRLRDDKHTAVGVIDGTELVRLDLFGIEDEGAMDRVRMETVGVWFEEPAPSAVLVQSSGISETAWGLALTSQRLLSHCHPAVITSNYPEESHWTWQRFVVRQHPGTMYVRIPPGERASPEQRAEWERALAGRPDMLKRLLRGEPGAVLLGDPVTPSYRESVHFQRSPLRIPDGPLFLAWDAWHHPAVAIGSMSSLGQLRVLCAQRMDNADVGALIEERVRPWLSRHALLERPRIHTGDRTMGAGDQSNRAQTAMGRVLALLPGQWRDVTNEIEPRVAVVNEHLRRTLSTGEPAILLGPDALELHRAWSGGWYKDQGGKPVKRGPGGEHSHVGDAGAYLCLLLFGYKAAAFDIEKWVNQTAYRQPWNGQPSGEVGISPAAEALAGRFPGFNRAAWAKQYEKP
jgi:hypothetical protein